MLTPEEVNLKQISEELLDMVNVDQKMRREVALGGSWIEEIDKKHTKRTREIVDSIGWPTNSKVGIQASHAAWLLVQHADHDVDFQEHVLSLMKECPEGEIRKTEIAMLEDRVRVNKGERQIYGTQMYVDEKGHYGPRPIEDEPNVDFRRSQVGLKSLEEYIEVMTKIYEEQIKKGQKNDR